MKGITPVIAIILLLLMAVAAAGGFYFVYQGFTESGEESGATQIEQLGEQSLAQIQIESAAGGRLYVRNVGASDIDLSKSTVYVENRPVSVNRSADTLSERNRAVLKLNEAPDCTTEKCEVKISGAASTSKTIDLSKLLCSSDADCYSGESCEGGVCMEGGEEEEGAYCGDGECGEGEDGLSCFEDCGPRSLLFSGVDWDEMNVDVYSFDWNGTTYVQGENVTNSTSNVFNVLNTGFDSQGRALALGTYNYHDTTAELWWGYDDGTGWYSSEENFTGNNGYEDNFFLGGPDFNSSDEAMAVWRRGESDENIGWASFDGTWSEPQNITDNGPEMYVGRGSFAFAPWDDGMAVWRSRSGDDDWVNYSYWDGSKWAETGTILSQEDELDHAIDFTDVAFNGTHAMAVWAFSYTYVGDGGYIIQWSTWDNSSWSPVQNVTDESWNVNLPSVGVDANGDWVMILANATSEPVWTEWLSWEGGWVREGNLTDENAPGVAWGGLQTNENGAVMTLLLEEISGSIYEGRWTCWDGTSWNETVPVDGEIVVAIS